MADDTIISFPIREILSRIETKLDDISIRLDGKADRIALEQLVGQFTDLTINGSHTARSAANDVHEIESRVRVLESTQASREAVTVATNRARSSLITSIVSSLTALASLIAALVVIVQVLH